MRCRSAMRLWLLCAIGLACAAPAVPAAPLFEVSAPSSIDCAHLSPGACVIHVPLTIDNPTSRTVLLRSIHATREGLGGEVVWSYDAKELAPGRTNVVPPTGIGAGRWKIELVASDAGRDLHATTTVTVRDRERDDARAACDACHGTWGAHGLAGTEGCDCRTTDAGKICHDASDCQGDCLDPTAEPGGASSHRFAGRCSPSTMNFGCLPRVRASRSETICVD